MAPTNSLPHTLRRLAIIVTVCAVALTIAGPAFAAEAYQSRMATSTKSEEQGAVENVEPQFDGTEVVVRAGQSLQAAVDANPAGTRFRIAAGLHRGQHVTPKDGNVFTGETGATLSGARVLTGFTARNGTWVLAGQTDETSWHGQTLPGQDRAVAIQDLWLDADLANHVSTRDAVNAPGTWFYDYDRDEIVLFDNPANFDSVELSTTEAAFIGTAADVVIEHLTITRYASAAQRGAIHGNDGRHWVIRHNTVTENHGVNVRVGPGFHVHNNLITKAGQLGIGGVDTDADGYTAPILVESNEIAENHTLGYDWGWEAGSTKFAVTTDMVFRNNWVHHNDGPGPWFDIDNRNALIQGNLVEHNTMVGIFYEISYGAEIVGNISRFNGGDAWGDLGAGIYVSSSSDVEIHDNAIYGNRSAILATHGIRGTGSYGDYGVTGLHVHHNDISEHLVSQGIRDERGTDSYIYDADINTFESNTYRMNADKHNFWTGTHATFADWQASGQDTNSRVLAADTTPKVAGQSFIPAAYGA